MPKLAKKIATKTEKSTAVSGGFEPYPPGKYIATLAKVESKLSSAGNPVWNAEFEDLHNLDGDKMPGRQWYNLNLPTSDTMPEGYEKGPEKWAQYQGLCHGRLKAFFEAFGYTADSDTDEFVGDKCVLQIGIGTISKGPRTGERTNQVNGVFSIDSVDGADAIGSDEKDEDEF